MLESIRRGQRWLTFLFVSVIGLVFVFFFGVGGSFGPGTPTGNSIVELDDLQLGERDFARAREQTEQRLRSQLGEEVFEQVGSARLVDAQALNTLVQGAVLAAAARDLGLHVTKGELRRVVQASPVFRDSNGRFDPEAFDRFASYEYGSQRAFIRDFTRELLAQKLIQLLARQTRLSDAEVDLRTRYELEEVRIGYVALPTDELPADVSLSLDPAEVEAWAAEHEESLRTRFEERAAELAEPERVRARHILVLAPPDASEQEQADARQEAEAARERIVAGESFEAVAAEVSDDAGTAEQGGDLGFFTRGDNDPALDEAAFGLEPGELSPVIRSGYGFHVLRVEERHEASEASFEDHRLELAREQMEAARARERAEEKSRALAEAIRSGTSLEEAAREHGLVLERLPATRRRADGYLPGLGRAEELLTTAFTLDAGESSPRIFELPDRLALIQVLAHDVPSAEELASERAARREQLEAEKQNELVQAWIDEYRTRLEESGRLRVDAARALGG